MPWTEPRVWTSLVSATVFETLREAPRLSLESVECVSLPRVYLAGQSLDVFGDDL